MKNSKEYGDKIAKLLKTLKRSQSAVKPRTFKEPLEAVLFALIAEFAGDSQADKLVKRLTGHFVDLNDLRVSRPDEILEVWEVHTPAAAAAAERLTAVLNAVFDKYDKLSLAELGEEGKRNVRKTLEGLNGITPFAAAYAALTAFGCHAVPLTDVMVEYLKQNQLVDPQAARSEIETFLERLIPAADAFGFYARLRAQIEQGVKKTAKKTAKPDSKKTAKKTEKSKS